MWGPPKCVSMKLRSVDDKRFVTVWFMAWPSVTKLPETVKNNFFQSGRLQTLILKKRNCQLRIAAGYININSIMYFDFDLWLELSKQYFPFYNYFFLSTEHVLTVLVKLWEKYLLTICFSFAKIVVWRFKKK